MRPMSGTIPAPSGFFFPTTPSPASSSPSTTNPRCPRAHPWKSEASWTRRAAPLTDLSCRRALISPRNSCQLAVSETLRKVGTRVEREVRGGCQQRTRRRTPRALETSQNDRLASSDARDRGARRSLERTRARACACRAVCHRRAPGRTQTPRAWTPPSSGRGRPADCGTLEVGSNDDRARRKRASRRSADCGRRSPCDAVSPSPLLSFWRFLHGFAF